MLWRLYWYYFGDLVTLMKKVGSTSGADTAITDIAGTNKGDLMRRLNKLSDPELEAVLKGEKTNGEPRLFGEIRNLDVISKREIYVWQKDLVNLEVEVCSMTRISDPVNEAILTPEKVYIPWPIEIEGGKWLNFNPRQMGPLEYHQDRDLAIDKPLCCIDALLKDAGRPQFRDRLGEMNTSGEKAQDIIMEYATALGEAISLPESMVITASKQLSSNRTYLESDGERLYLHIGLNLVNAGQLFEKWPEGAFADK